MQAGRKIGDSEKHNFFNKSDYNKRKKYREEVERGHEGFGDIRFKNLKRNIPYILVGDGGKNGFR